MKSSDRSTAEEVASATAPKLTWLQSLRVYLEPASLRMLALGFSAGLPLLLVLGTLSFWLREAGINRSTIGYLSWVGLAYAFKWCWAPLVDRLPIPWLTRGLGRRRSWLLLSQLMIVCGLVGMALTDPKVTLAPIVWFALLTAFGSATQDIALDAFRIESADVDHQSALAAAYMTGYRLAMIWAGAGVLWVAARAEVATPANYDPNGWKVAYLVMAASMIVGLITVLFTREPAPRPLAPSKNIAEWLQTVLIEPFADFFRRFGWNALLVLALIATYRVSDIVMGIMAPPFYVDMGYSKDEVAAISKIYGVIMTLVGALLAGVLSVKIGVMRTLMLGAVLSAAS
ncbi:MAG: MFS transporter, partial [Burkholderiales bacterium]|nr:MFS transporter [Burkholderiales bacterium]